MKRMVALLTLLLMSKFVFSQEHKDTIRLVLWFDSDAKYQILINNYCYEFPYSDPNSTGHPIGILYAVYTNFNDFE